MGRNPQPSSNLLLSRSAVNESIQSAPQAHIPQCRIWKLTLAYDGTDFSGWQVQPGRLTIQGELQAALGRIAGECPLPQGSGRTDAGVHALAQVASFPLRAPIPPENLRRALNRTLPSSIRILEAAIMADPGFHARHSATAKTYEYRVFPHRGFESDIGGGGYSPFLARYVYGCPWALDLEALRKAARVFVGEHDFRSFAASDPDMAARTLQPDSEAGQDVQAQVAGAVRTIYASEWSEQDTADGPLLVYRVRGNGFLHHMVRNLVGTMIDVGRGHLPVDAIQRILAARCRSEAGPTAPARGLFLHSVEYGQTD
jgi:tRNA pseudouridine38-40 synthase